MNYLGIDLGGTNVAVGIVSEEGEIIARGHRPCPRGNEPVAAAIVAACREAVESAGLQMQDICGAGLGSPGTVDSKRGMVVSAYNLQLDQAPLCQMISEELGIPVKIGNDANVAAYGEYLFGAGRESKNMIAITLGTGLGCGIVIDGALYEGFNGFAGEAGHMCLVPKGRVCTCGREGCFETYASATGLLLSARMAAKKHPECALNHVTGGDLDALDGKLFFRALETGDAVTQQVFASYVDLLALGLGSIVNLLQPEVICVGGGIAGAGEVLLAPLREALRAYDFAGNTERRVEVLGAMLGNDAGIIGAAMISR